MNKKAEDKRGHNVALGVSFGLLAGVTLASVFDASMGVWGGIGMCLGIAIGALVDHMQTRE